MTISFYNTLTHQVQEFQPLYPAGPDGKKPVYMYNCGPTVYDFAHIGNFRAFVFADVLRRFLELSGYTVYQVMNLTDVGHMTDDANPDGAGVDKMTQAGERLKEAKKSGKLPANVAIENPDDPYQVAAFYTQAFLEDARSLGLKIASEYPERMPRATDHVGRMMEIILKLVENGHAYVAPDKAVYFAVESFPDYGKLSGNTLDMLRAGAGGRLDEKNQAGKRNAADFLLWKPDGSHIMKWESPWGVGYPGWHIECTAMSLSVLSKLAGHPLDTIDIHTGGEDNIFPHHECEIAQSCGATGAKLFARFWMHTRFLLVDGEKMSKRKGNFYTVRDLVAKGADPSVIRYELLKAHYRSNMNFTTKGLADSASAVQRLRDFSARVNADAAKINIEKPGGKPDPAALLAHPVIQQFLAALSDDLTVSEGIGIVFSWLREPVTDPVLSAAVINAVDGVLGFSAIASSAPVSDEGSVKAKAIDEARAKKDFAGADRLRKELQDAGYEVMTTKAGTTARKRLA